jgi:DNA-binding NtrC family response regulator
MQTIHTLKGKEILLLEDDLLLGKRIETKLDHAGLEVTRVQNCADAQRALEEMPFDYALFDLNLPDGESLELLRKGKVPSNTPCILMTGEGGIQSAVESIRLGAADYLSKPFDLDELPVVLQQAQASLKSKRLNEHVVKKRKEKSDSLFFEGSFSEDLGQLKKVLAADNRLQSNLPPLLIQGPTGTGKSTYAKWIHANGPRANQPFVALNCSAIAENLVESELFGHEKGAFTDAKEARIGLFEAADQGTLFLDEITSLSLPAQAKLLLSIETGKIRRVGSTKEFTTDVRIIAAANQDLREMIGEGSFREDLFHRLDLLRITIPPLVSRSHDLVLFAKHLLTLLAQKYRLAIPDLGKESRNFILTHNWPGNVRELVHELERSLVLCEPNEPLQIISAPAHGVHAYNPVGEEDDWLNPSFVFPRDGFDLEKEILRLIERAISQANGNISEAARLLGVPRDYIRYRLQKKEV